MTTEKGQKVSVYSIIDISSMPRDSKSRSKSRTRKPKVVVDKENMKVKVGTKKFDLLEAKNGTLYYMAPFTAKDGKKGARPRFVAGSSKEYMEKIRRKSVVARRSRSKSKSRMSRKRDLEKRNASGMRAFLSHYAKKRYDTEKGRKIAMTRDLRASNQDKTKSLHDFRKDPATHDMRGVDMGEFKNVAELKKELRKIEKSE